MLTGTLPDGAAYSVPTFVANGAKVVAGGGGFLTTTVPGYSTDYHGLEVALVKRLSNRGWAASASRCNNAREHFAVDAGRYDTNGNPTPTLDRAAGRRRPVRAVEQRSSGSGNVYINAKWQFNANGDVPGAARHRGQRQRVRPAGLSVPAVPPRRRSAANRCRCWSRRRSTTSATTTCGTRTCASRGAFKLQARDAARRSATSSTCSTRTPCWCGTTTSCRRRSTRSRRTSARGSSGLAWRSSSKPIS